MICCEPFVSKTEKHLSEFLMLFGGEFGFHAEKDYLCGLL